jgi:6-phospho-beta-glucosidase
VSNLRIAVVGGGSQFAIGLSESLVDYARDHLSGATVSLLDVREDRLETVRSFASRLADEVGADISFEATTDRRRAFDGADFVLTTFRPGSHHQQEQDETVPPKYGLQGNETVGIGGIFMACRVAPVLREICADASELCPDAWVINYTNPTQHVADAIGRISDLRVISLCDGFIDVVDDLAYLLEVDPADVTVYPAGTNHAIWVVRFTVRGEDGYPLLRARLEELSDEDLERLYPRPDVIDVLGVDYTYDEIYKQFIPHYPFPFSLKLFRIYGLIPGPRYYWRYLLDQDDIVSAQAAGTYVSMAGFYMKHMEPRMFEDLDSRLGRSALALTSTRREGGGGHGDLAVRVIASMASDLGESFVVNVPNNGAVSNLPDDAILELSAVVDRQGAHPFAVGPLPDAVLGLQWSLLLSQQLAVTAALSGSRDDLLRAILAHPLVHSVDAAEGCMNELLALQAEWLPQFGGGAGDTRWSGSRERSGVAGSAPG